MASVSLPAPHPQWLADQHDLDTHRYSMPVSSPPDPTAVSRPCRLPNPSFSFPPQPDRQDGPSPVRQPARAPLPAFSFPQAPAEPSTPPLLPSVSPSSSAPSSPQRPVTPGHRRRPSGHVRSGSGREDVGSTVGISNNNNNKNNSSTVPPLPSLPPPPPPPQSSFLPPPGPGLSGQPTFRRSHAHRRSAAISSVDLTAVAKAFPPMPVAGISAPTTPADMKQQHLINNEDLAKSTARTFPSTGPRSPLLVSPDPVDRADDAGSLAPPVSAPVPAFHRPLSTISSESSTSTIRPAIHVKQQSGVEPSMKDLASTRPKTAGATVSQSAQQFTADDQVKRPVSASGHATPVASDVPPVPKLPTHLMIPFTSAPESSDSESPHSASEKKSTKKKKVRSWAGILTRKSKKRAQKKATPPRLSPTPTPPLPTLTRTNSAVGSLVNLDDDNLIVIRTPTLPNAPLAPAQSSSATVPSLETSWKPPSFYEQGQDSDVFSPVIDLDAALGPFNTPEMGPEAGRASGFSVATKRMYSGGRRGQFIGPEMRYHRRAESAPEMPPVDRTRLGPVAAMGVPDVFDEEEEDAFLAENGSAKQSSQDDQNPADTPDEKAGDDGELGLGIQIVDSGSRPSTVHEDLPVTPNDNSNVAGNASEPPAPRDTVHIVDTDQLTLRLDKPSEASTPPVRSPLLEAKRPSTSPDFGVPKFGLPSEFPPSMANLPSPDPDTASLEVPRLMTASSSITDRQTFSSGYSGDPYSDYFPGSTDDVPSLASAASGSTGNIPRGSSSFYSRSTTDPTHVTPRRPRSGYSDRAKRASLVSLTKLIGGASGERSKLSYEHKADDVAPEKIRKKAHRFSRLMTFWKDKEKEPKECE